MKNVPSLLLAIVGCTMVLILHAENAVIIGNPLNNYVVHNFIQDTSAQNAVTAIYLNYRVFDTLFEALLLLVSAMQVIHVSWRGEEDDTNILRDVPPDSVANSQIVSRIVGWLYPYVIILGMYLILNGHNSPGGGFQGGAILSTVFIFRYLVYPNYDLSIELFERIERIFFLCILAVPTLYLFGRGVLLPEEGQILYMMTLNTLIGLKVCSGLVIIFYRFVFYEGR